MIIVALFLLNACSKSFLDEQPLGDVSDAAFWKSETDLTAAVNGVYYVIRDRDARNIAQFFPFAANIPMNDIQETSYGDDIDIAHMIFSPTNVWLQAIWNGGFFGVTRANIVISRAQNMKIDETFKQTKVAEAKCLRGFYYLMLVRAYGDVPLITTEQTNASLRPARAPMADVLTQMVQDFTDAAAVLPVSWDDANLGRVTKGTALAYLALTNLYQADWNSAIANSEAVIGLNKYVLLPNHKDMYQWQNENTNESLFEAQFRDDPTDGHFLEFFLEPTTATADMGCSPNGWGVLFPSNEFRAAFEPGDTRRWQILSKGQTLNLMGGVTFTMDSTSATPNGLVCAKYWVGHPPSGNSPFKNIIILKYAEVLLNYAEALANANRFSDAYIQINKIRTRAGLPGKSASDLATCIADINKERRIENFMDENGWWDLTRTKQAAKFLHDIYGITMADKNYLFPIPQVELANNPNLTQNPGY